MKGGLTKTILLLPIVTLFLFVPEVSAEESTETLGLITKQYVENTLNGMKSEDEREDLIEESELKSESLTPEEEYALDYLTPDDEGEVTEEVLDTEAIEDYKQHVEDKKALKGEYAITAKEEKGLNETIDESFVSFNEKEVELIRLTEKETKQDLTGSELYTKNYLEEFTSKDYTYHIALLTIGMMLLVWVTWEFLFNKDLVVISLLFIGGGLLVYEHYLTMFSSILP